MLQASRHAGPQVELIDVTKRFGEAVAVRELSLSIGRGEFVALLGPSGCGKTTTLRMIAGFEEPSGGDIRLDGRSLLGTPPHKRDVNTVFQQYALFPHLSVLKNVAYGLKMRGVGRRERHLRAERALALVRLPERHDARPAELSGGQQQRVALARALVLEPLVLLLDEPLGALDLRLRKEMQIELKRIQEESGITFVVVTHDQEEAMALADRVAIMNAGRLEQIDDASDVYDRPATPFVATFVGEMNELAGRLERDASGERWLARPHARIRIERALTELPTGSAASVGIRQEDVRCTRAEAAAKPDGAGAVEAAAVLTSMTLGNILQVVATLADGQRVVSRRPRHAGGEELDVRPGDAIHVHWPAAAAVLLGPADAASVPADPAAVPVAAAPAPASAPASRTQADHEAIEGERP